MRQFLKLIAAGIAAFLFSTVAGAQANYSSQNAAYSACMAATNGQGTYRCLGPTYDPSYINGYYTGTSDWGTTALGKYYFVSGGGCPSGTADNGAGKCVAPPPTCNPPQQLNSAGTACVANPLYPPPGPDGKCADGQTLTGGACVPNDPVPTKGANYKDVVWLDSGSNKKNADGTVTSHAIDNGPAYSNCGGWLCYSGAGDYVPMANGGGCYQYQAGGNFYCAYKAGYTGDAATPGQPVPDAGGPAPTIDPPGSGGGPSPVQCTGGDGSTGTCICPTGSTNVNGACTANQPSPVQCTGGDGSSGTCICPTGYTNNAGTCQANSPTPVTCNGGDGSSGTCVCPSGQTNVNGTCTASGTGTGGGSGAGTGAQCGGSGQPPCSVTMDPGDTPPGLSPLSKGIMDGALSTIKNVLDGITGGGLDMHGVAFNWAVNLPENECQPWQFPIPGQNVVIDPCPVAEKIRSLAEYAMYFFTAMTLAWILFGGGKVA